MGSINEILMAVDSKITNVRVVKGPGSDGPFIQPQYFVYLTMADEQEEIALRVYCSVADNGWAIYPRMKDDPKKDLIAKLDAAVKEKMGK